MAKIPMADKEFKKDDEYFKNEVIEHKNDLALDYVSEARKSLNDGNDNDITKGNILKSIIVKDAEIEIEEYIYENHGYNQEENSCRLHLYIGEERYLEIGGRANKKKFEKEIKKDFCEIRLSNNRRIAEVYIRSSQKESSLIEQNSIPISEEEKQNIWEKPEYIKLFISHRHNHKNEVMALKKELKKYGIYGFVAHKDIKVTKEWMVTIENALNSMDVFLVYLTKNFSSGDWTNQEAGFALAKCPTIISMKLRKKNPHGFIGKFQALEVEIGSVENTHTPMVNKKRATSIFNAIWDALSDKDLLKKSGLSAFIKSPSTEHADKLFDKLKTIENFSDDELERLANAYSKNSQIHNNTKMKNEFLNFLNKIGDNNYEQIGLAIRRKKYFDDDFDDDLPF